MPTMTYDELVAACTRKGDKPGSTPYDYQRTVAEAGLPDVLTVPTGAGKTLAVVLGWLYRRRFHPDATVRATTPHWLVVCQPMRTLVEQVRKDVERWLDALRAAGYDVPVEVHVFMGGEPTLREEWRNRPDRDAVVIGTQDMLLSRALNRGFGSSRYAWPVEFGALSTGTHWVFDEVQLMGAAVPTGRQLAAFRTRWPSLLPHGSTWMSATVSDALLETVDNPTVETRVELSAADRRGPLSKRLQAGKRLSELELPTDPKQRAKALAERVIEKHRPGTLTIIVQNNVASAQALHAALVVTKPKLAADLLLLHSRFRSGDRRRLVDELIAPVPPQGRIVVSTQVIEAGMDLDAAVLFTEAAPWSSVVQRLGRCNRAGDTADAEAIWFAPSKPERPLPYDADELSLAMSELRSLEGQEVIPDGLAERVPPTIALHPVLRSRDLLALFDTTADIGGADIDVSPYVRDRKDDSTVSIAWRLLPQLFDDRQRRAEKKPTQPELCPAPLGKELRDWAAANRVYRYDIIERRWEPLESNQLRPNVQLLADVKAGGYTVDRGWDPMSKSVVLAVGEDDQEVDPQAERFEAPDDDSASVDQRCWVSLASHLLDTERAADALFAAFAIDDDDLRQAVVGAARLHDIGKAHAVFQDTMRRAADQKGWPGFEANAPLAKSNGNARHDRKFFRHELATALALLDDEGAASALDAYKPDLRFLLVYLTAAHHGRVRMTLRSLPSEERGRVLGVADDERLPSIQVADQLIPESTLRPSHLMGLGLHPGGSRPWFERADELLERYGPFNLALLEAIVRFADWRASSAPSEPLS